jgi:hypothetical protein
MARGRRSEIRYCSILILAALATAPHRAIGKQHHRQAVAKQILDRHAGVRGAGIDMH